MLDRILVGLDGSEAAETILQYVRALAQSPAAEVVLLHVATVPGEVLEERHDITFCQLVRRAECEWHTYLSRVQQPLMAVGLNVSTAVAVGNAAAEVVRSADQIGMNLIALTTHGRAGLQRWFYGSVAEEVVRTTYTPLLLVRAAAETPPVPREVRRIIVPLDGSLQAEAALPFAEVLASRLAAPMTLVRAVEPVVLPIPLGSHEAEMRKHEAALREAMESYLRRVAADVRMKDVSISTIVLIGPPAVQLTQYVGAQSDSLVVMSTRVRAVPGGTALGSVSQRVVRDTHAPVVLVRPPSLIPH